MAAPVPAPAPPWLQSVRSLVSVRLRRSECAVEVFRFYHLWLLFSAAYFSVGRRRILIRIPCDYSHRILLGFNPFYSVVGVLDSGDRFYELNHARFCEVYEL